MKVTLTRSSVWKASAHSATSGATSVEPEPFSSSAAAAPAGSAAALTTTAMTLQKISLFRRTRAPA